MGVLPLSVRDIRPGEPKWAYTCKGEARLKFKVDSRFHASTRVLRGYPWVHVIVDD